MSRYIQIPAPLEFYLDPDSLIYPIDTDEEEAAAKAATNFPSITKREKLVSS